MRNYLVCLCFLLPLSASFAQNSDSQNEFGNWNVWTNSLVFSPAWKFDTDVQFRTWQLGKDPSNLIFRGGITYVAKPWLEFQAGYGYFQFYPFGDAVDWKPNSIEHRPHQQILAKHKLKKISFNHRLRLDERFIQTPTEKNFLRPRYRFFASYPVVGKLYIFGTYEYFWTLSDWKYDQGRLHLGFGHPIGEHTKLEATYIRLFLKNSEEYNRLQINFISTLKLNSKEKS